MNVITFGPGAYDLPSPDPLRLTQWLRNKTESKSCRRKTKHVTSSVRAITFPARGLSDNSANSPKYSPAVRIAT